MPDLLRISTSWHRAAVQHNAQNGNILQIAIEASPEAKATAKSAPTQGELILILDRSGSMFGTDDEGITHINRMFDAVVRLINVLGPKDRLAIVAFHDSAATICELTSGEARKQILDKLAEFRRNCIEGGGTNMAPALAMAVTMVRTSARNQRGARIVVFTDGQAGDAEDVLKLVKSLEGQSIGALGFGEFDFAFMNKVCASGKGICFDIGKDLSKLEELFRQELTIAQQTFATNLRLRLKVSDFLHCTETFISHPSVDYLGHMQLDAGRSHVLDLGNFEQDLGKKVLINVLTAPRDPGPSEALRYDLLYDVPAMGLKGQVLSAPVMLEYARSGDERPADNRIENAYFRCVDELDRLRLERAIVAKDRLEIAASITRLERSKTETVLTDTAQIKSKLLAAGELELADITALTGSTKKSARRDGSTQTTKEANHGSLS